MKAKLVLDQTSPNPKYSAERAEQARKRGRAYTVPPTLPLLAGTVIDHPDAYRLVQMGNAIPEDEACRLAAGMTEEQMIAAQDRYVLLEQGMGFDEDGNAIDEDDEEDAEDDDDTSNP